MIKNLNKSIELEKELNLDFIIEELEERREMACSGEVCGVKASLYCEIKI